MSAENVQRLREGYAAFARQDLQAVLAAFDEEIEWTVPDSLPFGGVYRGHDEVVGFFGSLAQDWQGLSVEPVEFIDGGDTVVVIAHLRASGSDGSLDQHAVHLWRMRDGKATSFTEYLDTAKALQALGQGIAAQR